MPFQIKQGDTRPAYTAQLLDRYGLPGQVPLDLTNATQVLFKMRERGSTGLVVDTAMTITNPTSGIVQHVWDANDTRNVGLFDVEFEITWTDGGIETVPNGSYLSVEVVDDLDSP